ncbi:MAG TPA: hypothetical protein PL021_17205, partial [bacterium]|nr:hypothetical protein [bacterium]
MKDQLPRRQDAKKSKRKINRQDAKTQRRARDFDSKKLKMGFCFFLAPLRLCGGFFVFAVKDQLPRRQDAKKSKRKINRQDAKTQRRARIKKQYFWEKTF